MGWLRSLFSRIWEGFDTYLTMAFAAAVAIMSFFGLGTDQQVGAATLAIFFLIAFNIARNRSFHERDHRALETVERGLDRVTKTLFENRTFNMQQKAYEYIVKYLDEHGEGAKTATLIQYSCHYGLAVVQALRAHNTDVTVYVQHEETARELKSQEQAERIEGVLKGMRGELGANFDPNKLRVFKYRPPATLCAIRIDGMLLFLGWYTYDPVNDATRNPSYPTDELEISGHDIGGVLVWKNTPDYDRLNKTFEYVIRQYEAEFARSQKPGDPPMAVERVTL